MSASDDATRTVHLVGTIPARDTRQALGLVLETVGDRVGGHIPDGETGDRRDWIGRLIESLREHPDLELKRDGDWSDYETTPAFRVRNGHRFRSVALDYVENFERSWPEFEKVRAELGRGDLSFQVGIPGPIDVAFAATGFAPVGGLRWSRVFEDATIEEIRSIHERAGTDVVFQLEIPIEVELAIRARFLGPLGRRWLAGRILRVVRQAPTGSRWGFHLCVGDLNHRSFSRLKNATVPVKLTNALVAAFPDDKVLEFVHMPFAHAVEPPSTDDAFYAPLRNLKLNGSRFAAGFVHEGLELDALRGIQQTIESLVGHPVDVAASCGLGRRDPVSARRNLELSRALAD